MKKIFIIFIIISSAIIADAQTYVYRDSIELQKKSEYIDDTYTRFNAEITLPVGMPASATAEVKNWISQKLYDDANVIDADYNLLMRNACSSFFNRYRGELEEEKDNPYFHPWAFDLKITVETDQFAFFTLKYEKYINLGGAHPSYDTGGVTFRKDTGKKITWEDLFKKKDLVRPYVTEAFNSGVHGEYEMEWEVVFSHKNCDINTYPMPESDPYIDESWYVNFFYREYEIGPYAMGTPCTKVFAAKLKNVMTPWAKETFTQIGTEADVRGADEIPYAGGLADDGRGEVSILGVYVKDSDPETNVRNAPKGKVVGKLHDGDMIYIEEQSENGWFRINGNTYDNGSDDENKICNNDNEALWIHSSVITADWISDGFTVITMFTEPNYDSKKIEFNGYDERIQRILDIQNDFVKVKTKNRTGWVSKDFICGNSLTTCV